MFGYCKNLSIQTHITMRYLLYSAWEKITVEFKEAETQTSFPNIQLNLDEAQVYMVGVMVTLARLCVIC